MCVCASVFLTHKYIAHLPAPESARAYVPEPKRACILPQERAPAPSVKIRVGCIDQGVCVCVRSSVVDRVVV